MTLEADRECFLVVTPSVTNIAEHVHVGQEVHLDAPLTLALASLAPPTLHVEREAPRLVSALARFRQHGEQVSDRRKNSSVSRRIRPWRAPDRRLVDLNRFVDLVDADYAPMFAGVFARTVEIAGQRPVKNIRHQRRFART